MPMTGMNGIHERIEITAEREGIAECEIVLRIFAVVIGKSEESEAAVIERESTRDARQIIDAEMAEHDT